MAILFREPGVFLAWELINSADPKQLVDQVADSGFKWVAQEYGDPNTQPSATAIAALRSECHARGVYYGGWSVGVRLDLLDQAAPNFWVFNVETDYTDYSAQLHAFRAKHPLLPAGVITDCGIDAKPFIAANVRCLPEAYQQEPDHLTPAEMVARAHELGWTYVFPVLGVYHSYPLSSYSRAGDGWSVYLAAGMEDVDWKTAAGWNAPAAAPAT